MAAAPASVGLRTGSGKGLAAGNLFDPPRSSPWDTCRNEVLSWFKVRSGCGPCQGAARVFGRSRTGATPAELVYRTRPNGLPALAIVHRRSQTRPRRRSFSSEVSVSPHRSLPGRCGVSPGPVSTGTVWDPPQAGCPVRRPVTPPERGKARILAVIEMMVSWITSWGAARPPCPP